MIPAPALDELLVTLVRIAVSLVANDADVLVRVPWVVAILAAKDAEPAVLDELTVVMVWASEDE